MKHDITIDASLLADGQPLLWRRILVFLLPLAGVLSAWLLANHGWRDVYLAAGGFPLLLLTLTTRRTAAATTQALHKTKETK